MLGVDSVDWFPLDVTEVTSAIMPHVCECLSPSSFNKVSHSLLLDLGHEAELSLQLNPDSLSKILGIFLSID